MPSGLILEEKRINSSTVEFTVSRPDRLFAPMDRAILIYLLLLIPIRIYAFTHIGDAINEQIRDIFPSFIESITLGTPSLLLLIRVLYKLRSTKSESLLVIEGFGVQISARSFAGSTKCQFISIDRIEALIVNEGITLHTVIFYMALVIKGKPQMILLFDNLRPRLPIIREVYRKAAPLINPHTEKASS